MHVGRLTPPQIGGSETISVSCGSPGPTTIVPQNHSAGELKWAAKLLDGEPDYDMLVSAGDGVFAVSGGFLGEAVIVPGGDDEMVLDAEIVDQFVALFELK